MHLKFIDDGANFGPSVTELLTLLSIPFRDDFVREVGWLVEVSTAEIENKGTLDNGHCNNPRIIVKIQEDRDVTFADRGKVQVTQAQVCITFAEVAGLCNVSLERHRNVAFRHLAFRKKYDTLNSGAQVFDETE